MNAACPYSTILQHGEGCAKQHGQGEAGISWLRLFCKSAWGAHVTVQPDNSRMSVLTSEDPKGRTYA